MKIDATTALYFVFAGVFAFLALSSLVGWGFKLRYAAHKPHAFIDFFNARVDAWWAFVIFLGLAIWMGRIGVVIFFALISFQCLREYISVTKTRISDHHALVWSFYFFFPAQYICLSLGLLDLFHLLIPVCAFMLLPISSVLKENTTQFLSRTAQVHWGLMISVYFLSHIPALMYLQVPQSALTDHALLILFLLLVVQANNIFGFIGDKVLGRHPLAPSISSDYTIEGIILGLLCATTFGAAMYWITPFVIWQAAIIAFVLGAFGFAGRFVLLAIKRDRGVSDWGLMNESQNGMLDLVDSISFAAPVFFYIVHFFGRMLLVDGV